MTAPLIARGRVLGAVAFVSAESARTYNPEDLALAEELAQRAALAVDNARLYRGERPSALAWRLSPAAWPKGFTRSTSTGGSAS